MSRVKDLRIEKGLTQSQLAKLLGVSQPVISDIENEQQNYKIETLIKLCKTFKVSSDYIIGLSNKKRGA